MKVFIETIYGTKIMYDFNTLIEVSVHSLSIDMDSLDDDDGKATLHERIAREFNKGGVEISRDRFYNAYRIAMDTFKTLEI